MKKIIRLTESDLLNLVKRVIKEQEHKFPMDGKPHGVGPGMPKNTNGNPTKEVVANYTITPYNQVYEYGEEEIKDLYTWLGETIQSINNSIDYPSKIDETEQIEFFCTNLCSVSESCEPFQRYKEEKGGEKPLDDGLF